MMTPRWLNATDAAAYLSISRATFSDLVKDGRLPQPSYLTPRLPRWDREALDAAMGVAREVQPDKVDQAAIARKIADEIRAEAERRKFRKPQRK